MIQITFSSKAIKWADPQIFVFKKTVYTVLQYVYRYTQGIIKLIKNTVFMFPILCVFST